MEEFNRDVRMLGVLKTTSFLLEPKQMRNRASRQDSIISGVLNHAKITISSEIRPQT